MVRKLQSVEAHLKALRAAVSRFRETDSNAATVLLESFLVIASAPDHSLNLSDVAKSVQVTQSSMNHIIARLSGGTSPRLGGEALDLVTVRADPMDRRRLMPGLTAKGRNLATALSRDLMVED